VSSPSCIVADDHPALVTAVVDLLVEHGYDVAAIAHDGPTALAAATEKQPDIALVDFRMPRLSGGELVRRLRQSCPRTRVAVYTAEADPRVVTEVLDAGAEAVVLKESPLGDLLRALDSLLSGRPYVDSALASVALDGRVRAEGAPTLTARELEVLELLAEGLSHEAIARRLEIGSETVRTHARKAAGRLGAKTRTQAVASALRLRLIA
jgi:two-component system, NarL family, nitrate/nitrite response regulator NarL